MTKERSGYNTTEGDPKENLLPVVLIDKSFLECDLTHEALAQPKSRYGMWLEIKPSAERNAGDLRHRIHVVLGWHKPGVIPKRWLIASQNGIDPNDIKGSGYIAEQTAELTICSDYDPSAINTAQLVKSLRRHFQLRGEQIEVKFVGGADQILESAA